MTKTLCYKCGGTAEPESLRTWREEAEAHSRTMTACPSCETVSDVGTLDLIEEFPDVVRDSPAETLRKRVTQTERLLILDESRYFVLAVSLKAYGTPRIPLDSGATQYSEHLVSHYLWVEVDEDTFRRVQTTTGRPPFEVARGTLANSLPGPVALPAGTAVELTTDNNIVVGPWDLHVSAGEDIRPRAYHELVAMLQAMGMPEPRP